MGLRPHNPEGREFYIYNIPLASHPLLCLGVRASPFYVSALLTSFYMASSVNPWLLYFNSARLQLVIQVDCSKI